MKNYLVIGGSTGIGKALVAQLSGDKHRVYSTFNQHPEESIDSVSYHQLDVNGDKINLDFLPDKIDGVAYCPGSINLLPFARIKPEDFIEDYKLQVIGAVKVLQAVLPKLKAAGNSSIILFSTVAAQNGFNFHSQVSASKGAIEGLTKALAAELAPSIRVNAIAPSITDTPLASRLLNTEDKKNANAQRHPLKRIGTTEDIASMAAFLLSEKSAWITGQIIAVDGGISTIKN